MMRVGIIGGNGVGTIHARALHAVPGTELVMVAGSTSTSSVAAAERLGARISTADAIELAVSDEVDAVHVCIPNNLHFEAAHAALAAGKHVLCEKPLTLSPTDADRLVHQAVSSQSVTALVYNYRYTPLAETARRITANGKLGVAHTVRARYMQNWGLNRPDSWRSDPARGGLSRVLNDIGVHLLDLVEYTTGSELLSFHASFTGLNGASGPGEDDVVIATGEFGSGARLSFVASQVSAGSTNDLGIEIDGSTGSAEWALGDHESLRFVDSKEVSRLKMDSHEPATVGGRYWRAEPTGSGRLERLLQDFYSTIITGKRPERLPELSDGARHVRLIDDASNTIRALVAEDAPSDGNPTLNFREPTPTLRSQG